MEFIEREQELAFLEGKWREGRAQKIFPGSGAVFQRATPPNTGIFGLGRMLPLCKRETGIAQPVANKYLGVLSDLKIVERELPITEEKASKSKKGL